MCWSPRRAACSIICTRALASWGTLNSLCWTRPTACWTWVSCPMCAASWNAVRASGTPAETVKHVIYPVSDSQKTDLLLELLKRVNYESVLVFCRTKYGADRVAHLLKRSNHAVAVLHSNRTQREREQALRGFRDGRYEVLVATDIAARGLDIADVTHVINYDVP